tara:strand:+ start:1670 stop:2197 length:528 start_codon:yes stop_codon:yes gene_type:complete
MKVIFFLSFLFFTFDAFSSNKDFVKLIKGCSDEIQEQYEVNNTIPVELVLAQAILESNWGKSRFAIQGNNFFGMRTWDKKKKQMKPLKNPDAEFGLVVYQTPCDSVADYIENLNTSENYQIFRDIRSIELSLWGHVDAVNLANGLRSYSEQKSLYISKVKKKIRALRKKGYLNSL